MAGGWVHVDSNTLSIFQALPLVDTSEHRFRAFTILTGLRREASKARSDNGSCSLYSNTRIGAVHGPARDYFFEHPNLDSFFLFGLIVIFYLN